jgi:hypothetical protein
MLAKDFCITSMKSPLDQKANKKRPHVFLSIIFGFISTSSKFRNHDPMQVGFSEDLMLLIVKRLLPMKMLSSSSSKSCHTNCVHE